MAALDTEIETYRRKLPELLAHAGKFVLIHQDKVEGFFDAYGDALQAGYDKHKKGPFLVKQVTPTEQVMFFTRDILN